MKVLIPESESGGGRAGEVVAPVDYFALFGVPRSLTVDGGDLAARYRRLQGEAHPDRFAGAPAWQRQAALVRSSEINDAYAALKKPLARAVHWLRLHGVDAYSERDTAMPPDFLEMQLEWREALEEAVAADDAEARGRLREEIGAARDETAAQAAVALAALEESGGGGGGGGGGAAAVAYEVLRRWVYLEKLVAQAA